MKRLLRAAAHLYPRAWRDRHGQEFDALIDDLTPRWWHIFDIIGGALIMQSSRLAVVPVAMGIAGAIIGAAVSLAMPPIYASSSMVLVQVPGTADGSERGQRIRMAIDAALDETAFDKRAIAVTLRGEAGREPVLLEVSASADSAQAAQQAAEMAMSSIIKANLVASGRLDQNPGVQFRAVQPPNLPQTAHRDTTRTSALGAGLGLVTGGLFALLRYRRRSAI